MKHAHSVKIITTLVVLTAIILASGICAQSLLGKDADRLGKAVDEIIKATEAKDWNKANEHLEEVNEIWNNVKGTWSALIDHQEIDSIDETLSRMKMLIKSEEVSFTMAEAAALKKYIDHIPEKEKLNIENIF